MGSDDNCLSVTGRVVLGILNTVVLVIGFVLLILGILVFAYTPAFDFIFSNANAQFQAVPTGSGGSSSFNAELLLDVVKSISYVLIGLGVFFFIIGLLGLIGGCCKIKFALIVYTILLLLLIIAQIILMIIVFSQRQVLEPSMKEPLMAMVDKYEGADGTSDQTITMNFLMITLQCCGVNNYMDFKKVSAGGTWDSVKTGQDLTTPLVCCLQSQTGTACAENPGYMDAAINNANKGCYNEIWSSIDTKKPLVIGICSSIIILQVVLVLFAIYIVYRMAKTQKVG